MITFDNVVHTLTIILAIVCILNIIMAIVLYKKKIKSWWFNAVSAGLTFLAFLYLLN